MMKSKRPIRGCIPRIAFNIHKTANLIKTQINPQEFYAFKLYIGFGDQVLRGGYYAQ